MSYSIQPYNNGAVFRQWTDGSKMIFDMYAVTVDWPEDVARISVTDPTTVDYVMETIPDIPYTFYIIGPEPVVAEIAEKHKRGNRVFIKVKMQ